jgi:Cu(I)/Ag(I) efflux system membrane fusion protein
VKLFVVAAAVALALVVQDLTPVSAAEGRGGRGGGRGGGEHGPAEPAQPPNVITPTYNTTGNVVSITDGFIRIDHGEITELDWPAMIMTYEVRNPQMVANLKEGTPVRFSFRREGFAWVLLQISAQ